MFCPKCGGKLASFDEECGSCGNKMATAPSTSSRSSSASTSSDYGPNKIMGYTLAVIVFLFTFYAAHSISEAGTAISQIKSVGGQTMEEAYYFELGGVYAGFAHMARATGVFFSSVIVLISNKG